jgi:hypothetical protein
MQSKKVLIMPDRSRLRHDENPPYPEFAISMVREFTKAISEEISPIREDIGGVKYAITGFQSEVRKHGEKLEEIQGHLHVVKGILWFIGVLGAGVVLWASALQVYRYLH